MCYSYFINLSVLFENIRKQFVRSFRRVYWLHDFPIISFRISIINIRICVLIIVESRGGDRPRRLSLFELNFFPSEKKKEQNQKATRILEPASRPASLLLFISFLLSAQISSKTINWELQIQVNTRNNDN